MEKLGGRFGRGRGVASVDGEVACEATAQLHHPGRGGAAMTRIAVLSDVHGNAVALEAVRKAIRAEKPDVVRGRRRPRPQRARTRPAAVDVLREMEADGAVIVQGNTDIAVADFDYAAAFPWMTDGVPDTFRAAAEWAHDELGDERVALAAPAAGRAPAARRRRHDGPRLPRLARARRRPASTRRSTRTSSSSGSRAPTPGSSPAATPTCPRSATSAGSSSSTTDRRATSSTATRPPRGRCIDIDDGEVTAEIRRTEFDVLAVANAISARGLPGRRLSRRHRPHREAGPMTDRTPPRRRHRDGPGHARSATTSPSTWAGLVAGRSGVRTIESFDPSRLDRRGSPARSATSTPSGVLDRKELRRTDRYIQFGLVAAREALDQAGLPERFEGELAERTGRDPRDRAGRRRDAHRRRSRRTPCAARTGSARSSSRWASPTSAPARSRSSSG